MSCKYCGKPVVLVPSAAERAKKFGGKPSSYTALFPNHASCMIRERSRQSRELARRTPDTLHHGR